MIDQKRRGYRFETSSLLPLKLILIEAEKVSPPRIRNEQKDMNEELALKLIARMKKSIVIARSVGCDEAISLTCQRLLRLEERPPRDDIKIEP